MDYGFCSILSKYRLYQGMALYNSLKKNLKNFILFILCMDEETYDILKKLDYSKVVPINLREVENERLLKIKKERTLNEYCWTLKPVFLVHVLENYSKINVVLHIDADIFFYSDPLPIFEENETGSVLFTTHLNDDTDYDINSGFVVFKRNNKGIECLKWWETQCLNWCYYKHEGEKFGDQGYLNIMLRQFEDVKIIRTPGVNIAPWNYFRFRFRGHNSIVYVNDEKLIFYHFCGIRIISKNEYALLYGVKFVPEVLEPYYKEIRKNIDVVEKLFPGFSKLIGDEKHEGNAEIHSF